MPDSSSIDAQQILAACRAGAGEAAEAFQRSLDLTVEIRPNEPTALDLNALPAEAGLAIVLSNDDFAAVLLISDAGGMLPDWSPKPDATGTAKLTTLAQELGMVLLPEDLMPEEFSTGWVERLRNSVVRGEPRGEAFQLKLELVLPNGNVSAAWLILPLTKPAEVLRDEPPSAEVERPPSATLARSEVREFDDLPDYIRSLLRVQVPVVVTLARKRQTLGDVLELGPGAVIQFEKSCEDLLDLEVNRQAVATGEAVKVGEVFGLRIINVVMPEERFVQVGHKS